MTNPIYLLGDATVDLTKVYEMEYIPPIDTNVEIYSTSYVKFHMRNGENIIVEATKNDYKDLINNWSKVKMEYMEMQQNKKLYAQPPKAVSNFSGETAVPLSYGYTAK